MKVYVVTREMFDYNDENYLRIGGRDMLEIHANLLDAEAAARTSNARWLRTVLKYPDGYEEIFELDGENGDTLFKLAVEKKIVGLKENETLEEARTRFGDHRLSIVFDAEDLIPLVEEMGVDTFSVRRMEVKTEDAGTAS